MEIPTLAMEVKMEPIVDMHPTSAGMINDILSRMEALEPRRNYMFITWLYAHNSQIKSAKNIREGLRGWFDSLPCENAQWEHRLIKREIEWWLEQTDRKIDLLMVGHFSGRRS